ncbi:MAG: L-rhamnose/proton symporter RhaT [Thermoguttaceae bacterium]|jgi:L-rhamnose-H+ transport protein
MPLLAEVVDTARNPALGVFLFALGGLGGAMFYLPVKKVKGWAWESSWMVLSGVALILVPWGLALLAAPNTIAVLRASPGREITYCFLCGLAWGIGGLTFGLMLRYLGIGLGYAVGCGLCSVAGTLIPPILKGEFDLLLHTPAGMASLAAVLVSVVGIVTVGGAGISKTNELPEEERKAAIAEFNLPKGLFVATISGLMSAAMSMGLQGGGGIEKMAQTVQPVTNTTWRGVPVMIVVMLGGFLVNCGWCLYLNVRNHTLGDYLKSGSPLTGNVFFAAIAGFLWCSQYICFKVGEPAMGRLSYIGWAVLMASLILFSAVLGIFLGEWHNTSRRTHRLLASGLVLLVVSSIISGYAGYLRQ